MVTDLCAARVRTRVLLRSFENYAHAHACAQTTNGLWFVFFITVLVLIVFMIRHGVHT